MKYALPLLLLMTVAALADPYGLKEPSAEEIALMEQAMPAKPTAKPGRPRRILILSRCDGFKHSSIPFAEKAFEILGKKTGAFTTFATIDTSIFESPELDTFDVIVMNNTTMRLPLLQDDTKTMTEDQKKAFDVREAAARKRFLDFVRNGKGLVAVHAGTDCFYKWAEYGELIGGYFNSHPWHEDVGVKLDDPGHPLAKAFRGQAFVIKDEIYQFKMPYSREKLRVLLSLDANHTDMTKKAIKRTDGDFAVSWIREFGRGRVFYLSLGHRHEIFWNEAVMQCYLDGIQYALGDLPCDATPSAQLSDAYLAQSRKKGYEEGIDAIFRDLAGYEMGRNDPRAKLVAAMVLKEQKASGSDIRADLSIRLARVAADAAATTDGRVFACRQLALIGMDNAIADLAGTLGDAKVGGWARRALEAIPGKAAGEALLTALPKHTGLVQAGIADSLGVRKVAQAVPALVLLLTSADRNVAAAAANALGRIGTREAAAALKAAPAVIAPAAQRALLACAGNLQSKAIYTELLAADVSPAVRAAAFEGKAVLDGAKSAGDVVAALKLPDVRMACAAANVMRQIDDTGFFARVVVSLPKFPSANQPFALDALAERGVRAAQSTVLALAERSPDASVKLAALRALEFVGDAKAVQALLAAAASDDKEHAAAASRSLARMTPQNVNPALVAALDGASTSVQTQVVGTLGTRKAVEAIPALLNTARSKDRNVAKKSRKSLALLAAEKDVPALIALLAEQTKSKARNDLELIVVNVSRRIEEDGRKTTAITQALATSELPSKARASLLSALGRIGAASGQPVLMTALDSADDDVKRAAIKALADWPDATPMEHLRVISREDDNLVFRVLALRGYARQLAMPSTRSMRDTFALYRDALDLAGGEQERKTLVMGLGNLCHPDALDFIRPFLQDPAVKDEALMAALRVTQALDGQAMVFTASHGQGSERNAVDGVETTRWTSGKPMAKGMWFQVDLGYETDISEIWTFAGPVGSDWPRAYEIYVSLDGENWGESVVTGGDAKNRISTISFTPKYGRHVKLVQTGGGVGNFWSIAEMRINGRPSASGKKELDRTKWKMSAARNPDNCPPSNAIDGDRNKRWGTGGGMKPTDWLQVDLGEEKTVYKVVVDAAKSRSDYPRELQVMASRDGKEWEGPIGMAQGTERVTSCVLLPTKARFLRLKQMGSHGNYWWSVYDMKVFGE